MEEVRKRLAIITRVWNRYIWEYKFVQDHINFTSEVRTNYYGDILAYFNDTLELLKVNQSTDFKSSIFNATGLMQIIFVHQDLTDELLQIFGLPKSFLEDKEPNRTLRNELIGHPISRNRKTKELVSSIFFGNELSGDTIHYILYADKNNFKGEDIVHKMDEILSRHADYLLKYTGQILEKVNSILTFYREKLVIFRELVNKRSDLTILLEQTDLFFESAYKENYTFKRDYLLWYYEHRNNHPRYAHAIDIFVKTLALYIQGKIEDIDEMLSPEIPAYNEQEKFKAPKIVFVVGEQIAETTENANHHLHYELSKLMERHPIFNVSNFQRKYPDRPDVQEELSNMDQNYHLDREYYASYEYIRNLLGDREIL